MKLWLLRQYGSGCDHEGEILFAVIRAETEQDARKWGGNFYADEGIQAWLDPSKSMCIELAPDGEADQVYIDMENV